MSEREKTAGNACPSCFDRCPAEYAQMGQPPRWTCHACGACGASGPLLGAFDGRKAPAAAPAPPTVKKHWRTAWPSS